MYQLSSASDPSLSARTRTTHAAGNTCVSWDERDIDAMSAHILAVANEPALAARLGAAGRARVLREHTLEKSIAVLQEIVDNAAA